MIQDGSIGMGWRSAATRAVSMSGQGVWVFELEALKSIQTNLSFRSYKGNGSARVIDWRCGKTRQEAVKVNAQEIGTQVATDLPARHTLSALHKV